MSGPLQISARRGAAVLTGAASAAALAVLDPLRPAGADWSPPASPVTVTFWDSTSALKTKLYTERIIPAYKQRRPTYTVRYESIPTGNLLQKILAATAAGTAPEIFELGDWLLPTYFGRDLLDPVPPEAFGFQSLRGLVDSYLPGSPVGHGARRQAPRPPRFRRRLTACTSTTGCFARPGWTRSETRRRRGTTSRSSTRSSPSGRTARSSRRGSSSATSTSARCASRSTISSIRRGARSSIATGGRHSTATRA